MLTLITDAQEITGHLASASLSMTDDWESADESSQTLQILKAAKVKA
jgi:hypothetical protein